MPRAVKKVRNITLYGPKNTTMRSGVIYFEGIHSHDIATLLDREGIARRTSLRHALMKNWALQAPA